MASPHPPREERGESELNPLLPLSRRLVLTEFDGEGRRQANGLPPQHAAGLLHAAAASSQETLLKVPDAP